MPTHYSASALSGLRRGVEIDPEHNGVLLPAVLLSIAAGSQSRTEKCEICLISDFNLSNLIPSLTIVKIITFVLHML